MAELPTVKKIVVLVPYAKEILEHWEVSGVEYLPPRTSSVAGGREDLKILSESLLSDGADVEAIIAAAPDVVVTDCEALDARPDLLRVTEALELACGKSVTLLALAPRSLDRMYSCLEELGSAFKKQTLARDLSHRIKAQLMDWCDAFYDRMKNKRVTVLSSVTPLRIAGRWIPDLIKAASCHPQFNALGGEAKEVSWSDITTFRPDVLLVAPEGFSLEESVRTLKLLERMPGWEGLPAVKRGEVAFLDGEGLYRPGPKLLSGAANLVSAIAGLESGYITQRDSFYRLRWVELHRHKF